MSKLNFIPVLFFVFMVFTSSGLIDSPKHLNQLLAYICFHSVGISLIASETQYKFNTRLTLGILIAISSVVIFQAISINMTDSEGLMFFVLFFLNNWFLIAGTKLFTILNGDHIKRLSAFRYLVLSLSVLFLCLYMSFPTYLFITKWWILSGIFYIPYMDPLSLNFWISSIFIAISLVSFTVLINKKETSV
jgi:hypothetical protein